MLRVLLLSLLLLNTLLAEGRISTTVSIEPANMPTGHVDVISGAYADVAVDHIVNCIQPIVINRTFCTFPRQGYVDDWRLMCNEVFMQFEPNYRYYKFPSKVALQMADGYHIEFEPMTRARCSFRGQDPHVWTFRSVRHAVHSNTSGGEISGRNNKWNYRLEFHRESYTFVLITGSGEKRIYKLIPNWKFESDRRRLMAKKPNKETIQNRFVLTETIFPNGNRHLYIWDRTVFKEIRSVNHDNSIVYGWVKISHPKGKIVLTTSDGQVITYGKDTANDRSLTQFADSPRNGRETYQYGEHDRVRHSRFLTTHHGPTAPIRAMRYYVSGKYKIYSVEKQEEPLGPNGSLITAYRFEYATKTIIKQRRSDTFDEQGIVYRTDWYPVAETFREPWSDVYDAYDNRTRYHGLRTITKIEKPDGSTVKQKWGGWTHLLEKSHHSPKDELILSRKFDYDANHNVLKETLTGNLIGGKEDKYTKEYTYSQDGKNLILSEADGTYKLVHTYKPDTDLLIQTATYSKDSLEKFETWEYDQNACLRKHHMQWGTQDLTTIYTNRIEEPAIGMPQTIEEYAGNELLQQIHLHYNHQNLVTKKEIYDATGTFRYSLTYAYDKRGRCIKETDAAGGITTREYDTASNLTTLRGPRQEILNTFTYDAVKRLTSITKTDTQGNRVTQSFAYDLLSNKTAITDISGQTLNIKYDTMSNPIETLEPPILQENGTTIRPKTTRLFDTQGNVLTETDPSNNTTTYTYNARKQVTTILYPDRSKEHLSYNLQGHLTSQTAKNGTKTLYTRDYLGRILTQKIVAPDGELLSETTTTYDGPNKTTYTDPEGHTTYYTYDKAGRPIQESKAGHAITYTYDALGRQATTQQENRITRTTYDNLNRPIAQQIEETTGTLFTRIETAYDPDGNKIKTTTYQDTEPLHTHYTYDLLGKPTSRTDALGHTTLISYDYAPLQRTTTNPNGLQTITLYNHRQKPIRIEKKSPLGETLTLTHLFYDLQGNKIAQIHSPDARITRREYTHNRLTRLHEACDTPLQRTTRYYYNAHGQLQTTTKPSGKELHRTYDTLGRLSTLSTNQHDIHYTYTYDRNNNITQASSATGTTTRSYDAHNHLLLETLETGHTTAYTYDTLGRRTSTTLPDSTIHYTYDALHIKTITHQDLTHHYLSYDLQGNLLSEEHLSGQTSHYTYDPLNRCTTRTSPFHTQSAITYDPVGNILSYNDKTYSYGARNQLLQEPGHTYSYDTLKNRTSHNQETYTINELNQPQDLTYDPDGNLLSYQDKTFTYDPLGRLITLQTPLEAIHYTYDPFNRRLTANGTQFLYDHQREIGTTNELRILNPTKPSEIGAAIAIILEQTYIPIHDHLGSIVTLLTTTGEVAQTYKYTAYGECGTTDTNPYRFLSKRQEGDLINFGRRSYIPSLGRWLTPDPRGHLEGPNLYAYALNNPLTTLDLWGLSRKPPWDSGHHYDPWSSALRWSGQTEWIKMSDDTWAPKAALPRYTHTYRSDKGITEIYNSRMVAVSDYPNTQDCVHIYAGGMNSSYDDHINQGNVLASETQRQVLVYPMPSAGLINDCFSCAGARAGFSNRDVREFRAEIKAILDATAPNGQVRLSTYSRSAIYANRILKPLKKEYTIRVSLRTIAPGELAPKNLCSSSVNYLSPADHIVRTDYRLHNAIMGKSNDFDIYEINHPKGPWHSFNGPIVQEAIRLIAEELIEDFPETEEENW